MKAALLISHGSRFAETKKEVKRLVRALKAQSRLDVFEFAFLELEEPSIPEGIDICVQKGATEIVILFNFLNSGRHVDRDIPEIIEKARKRHPHIPIKVTPPVGQHKKIAELFLEMLMR